MTFYGLASRWQNRSSIKIYLCAYSPACANLSACVHAQAEASAGRHEPGVAWWRKQGVCTLTDFHTKEWIPSGSNTAGLRCYCKRKFPAANLRICFCATSAATQKGRLLIGSEIKK